MSDAPLTIEVKVDEEKKTITITDTGVGMTTDELSANLGTIAKSGSREFMADSAEQMTDIIGKFGVGFYSAFMIGSRVTVTSKSATLPADHPAATWTSDGGGEFEIGEDPDSTLTRGSSVTIELKETEGGFGSKAKIEEVSEREDCEAGLEVRHANNRRAPCSQGALLAHKRRSPCSLTARSLFTNGALLAHQWRSQAARHANNSTALCSPCRPLCSHVCMCRRS